MAEFEAEAATAPETMKQAATLGSVPAQMYMLGLFETGQADMTVEEARSFARRAAEGGDVKGMYVYAMYLFDGHGGPANRVESLDWLLKSANAGLIDAQFNVAKLYENGDEGIPANLADAYKWYLIVARAGDADAQEAVKRIAPKLPAEARAAARTAAEAFQVEPLA